MRGSRLKSSPTSSIRPSTRRAGTLLGIFALTTLLACSDTGKDGGNGEGLAILQDAGIDQIAFIARAKRLDVGDVFQYTSYSVDPKSANIFKLSSVSGGAEPEAITPFGTGEWPKADIMAMDVSFDGQEIVFSARLEGDSNYNIYRIRIDGTNPEEPGKEGPALIHMGPYDSVFPVYLPNNEIFFMTNEPPEAGIRQFRDEYERGLTAQAAVIDKSGGSLRFGPRNLSHRVSPTLVTLGDDNRGQILHTNWDHINQVNEGNLMVMNPDMSGGAEFFGKEGSGVANSYLKPRQVNKDEFVAIATDRQRTFQAGALILIDRGQNEATAQATILTPDVPLSKEPSYDKVGRYYDAYPITDSDGKLTHLLTSWANGPVQTDVAGGGMNEEGVDYGEGAGPPDFGLYVLDPKTGKRLPLVNDTDMWEVLALPIGKARPVPVVGATPTAQTPEGTALIGALNVHESSLDRVPGSGTYRVRVIEGFSTEEGVPDDFGLTEADGAILLGEAPVEWQTDGSFAAFVPEDRPVHLQLVDAYGLSQVNEDRWFSSAAGEQRFCGGCHEERGGTSVVQPGLSEAFAKGPANLALPYPERRLDSPETQDFTQLVAKLIWPEDPQYANAGRLRGIPWDMAIQPIFDDAGCATCHNGTPGPANPSVTIQDTLSPDAQPITWTFDLSGEKVDFEYGLIAGNFTKSHISVLFMAGVMNQPGVQVTQGDPNNPYQTYMVPESARDSILIKYIQPERLYPTWDPGDLAFAGEMKDDGTPYESQHPSPNTPGFDANVHRPLTAAEKYLLILAADLGGQYYSLENAPGQMEYGG